MRPSFTCTRPYIIHAFSPSETGALKVQTAEAFSMLILFMAINAPVKCALPYHVSTGYRTHLPLTSASMHATGENLVRRHALCTLPAGDNCLLSDGIDR